jgi:hypothetical protein
MSDQKNYLLNETDIPTRWYNVQADLDVPLAPALHPGTGQPAGPDDFAPLFPRDLIMQEVSKDRWIDIPEPVRDVYRIWRPTPLFLATGLEKALGTPALKTIRPGTDSDNPLVIVGFVPGFVLGLATLPACQPNTRRYSRAHRALADESRSVGRCFFRLPSTPSVGMHRQPRITQQSWQPPGRCAPATLRHTTMCQK